MFSNHVKTQSHPDDKSDGKSPVLIDKGLQNSNRDDITSLSDDQSRRSATMQISETSKKTVQQTGYFMSAAGMGLNNMIPQMQFLPPNGIGQVTSSAEYCGSTERKMKASSDLTHMGH